MLAIQSMDIEALLKRVPAKYQDTALAIVEVFQREDMPRWLSRDKLRGELSENQYKNIEKALLERAFLIKLGQLKRKHVFALGTGEKTDEMLTELAAELLLEMGQQHIRRLKAMHLKVDAPDYAKVFPTVVRKKIIVAVERLKKEGLVFTVKISRSNYFFFSESILQQLEGTGVLKAYMSSDTVDEVVMPQISGVSEEELLWQAYEDIKSQRRHEKCPHCFAGRRVWT